MAPLGRFLDGWSPYDIDVLDVGECLPDAELDELALAVNTHRLDTGLLRSSRVLFCRHDDCYFQVESADATLPARLLNDYVAELEAMTGQKWTGVLDVYLGFPHCRGVGSSASIARTWSASVVRSCSKIARASRQCTLASAVRPSACRVLPSSRRLSAWP